MMQQLDIEWDTRGYPEHCAGAKKVGTSEQAAREITPRIRELQNRFLDAFETYGAMSADRASKVVGVKLSNGRPRCSELVTAGKLVDTGNRERNDNNKSVTVWDIPRASVLGVGR